MQYDETLKRRTLRSAGFVTRELAVNVERKKVGLAQRRRPHSPSVNFRFQKYY